MSAENSPRTPPIGASWYAPKRAGLSAWGQFGSQNTRANEVSTSILPKPEIAQNQSQPLQPNKINNIRPKPPQKP
jgi:hypothetical protein